MCLDFTSNKNKKRLEEEKIKIKEKAENLNFVLGKEGITTTSGRPHTVAPIPKQIEYKPIKNGKVESNPTIKQFFEKTSKNPKLESKLYSYKGNGKDFVLINSKGERLSLDGKKMANVDIDLLKEVKGVERYISGNNPNTIYIKTPDGKIINPAGKTEKFITEKMLKDNFQKIVANKGKPNNYKGQRNITETNNF